MKKIFLLMIVFVLTISFASAQRLSETYVDDYTSAGSFIQVHTNVRNYEDSNIENAVISFWIPELDIYERTSSFDIGKNVNYGRFMYIYVPDVESGIYSARLGLYYKGKYQYQWRIIIIE